MMTKSTPLTPLLALCGLLAVATPACKQAVHCAELGDCGGDVPIGTWSLEPATANEPAYGSCIEDLYVPVSDPRLIGGGDVPAARTPPPEPALYDWCDALIFTSGNMPLSHAAVFYTESAPVAVASITLLADGTFSSGITRTGQYLLDFPAVCMREFTAMDGTLIDSKHPELGTGDVCQQLQTVQRAAGAGPGSYENTTCVANTADPGGCVCAFEDQETGGPVGRYNRIDSNTIQFLSQKNFPNLVTYCNNGTTLQLTGKDGEYLFGTRGLRTLDLKKFVPNCTDGKQGEGEDGIDCGPQCPATTCPPVAPAML